MNGLSECQIERYNQKLIAFARSALAAIVLVAGIALANTARADVTFAASVTNANGSLSTTLTWNAPGASTCTATGHPAWSGEKAPAGSQDLPAITLSGTYSLTLTCTFAGDIQAELFWTNATQNTDGSDYVNAAGTRIHYGRAAGALTETIDIADPTVTAYTIEGLADGEWFFAAQHYNTLGVSSDLTGTVSKTIRATSTEDASVALTVNPIPSPPTDVRIE